jgi:hypothetical protein
LIGVVAIDSILTWEVLLFDFKALFTVRDPAASF